MSFEEWNKEREQWPKPPVLRCSMEMGLFLGLDNSVSGGEGETPPTVTFPYGGVLGVNGFGFFVFGAKEGF